MLNLTPSGLVCVAVCVTVLDVLLNGSLLGVLGVEVGREETLGEWDMSWARLDTKTLVSLRESLALRIAEGGLLAALSPRAPIPDTSGDTPVARGELWSGELLALSLPRPGMGTGLEEREICLGDVPDPEMMVLLPDAPTPTARGLEERDSRLGVAGGVRGGVAPLPLARDSPMALTRSLTDTPWSSGGTSREILHWATPLTVSCCVCCGFLSCFLSPICGGCGWVPC